MSSEAAPTAEFDFEFDPRFRWAELPFGVRARNSAVYVTEQEFIVSFGPWSVRTPLSNLASAEISRDYAWPKVIGPARLSMADKGLTFATNPDEGVCVGFHEPVRGADPFGLVRHPSLTVTVRDTAGLVATITTRALLPNTLS